MKYINHQISFKRKQITWIGHYLLEKISLYLRNLQTTQTNKNPPGPDGFTVEFHQIFKNETIQMRHKYFINWRGWIPLILWYQNYPDIESRQKLNLKNCIPISLKITAAKILLRTTNKIQQNKNYTQWILIIHFSHYSNLLIG